MNRSQLVCRSRPDDLVVLVGPSPVLLQRLRHIEKLFPGKRILLQDYAPWISRHFSGGCLTPPTRASRLFEIYLPRWMVASKSVVHDAASIFRQKKAHQFRTTARTILADPGLLIEDASVRTFLANFASTGGKLFLFGHGVLLHPNLSSLDTEHFVNTTLFHFCRSDPVGDLEYLRPKFVSIIDCDPKVGTACEVKRDQKRILILVRKPNSHLRSQYRHELLLKCVDELIRASLQPATYVLLVHPSTSLAWARRETKFLRSQPRSFGARFSFERYSRSSIAGASYAVTSGSNLTIEFATAGVLVFQVEPTCKTDYDKRASLAFWTKSGLALEVNSGAEIAESVSSRSRASWVLTAQRNASDLFGD